MNMKILIADDHHLIRHGMRSLISNSLAGGYSIFEASTFEQAHLTLSQYPEIEMAIMDVRMTGHDDLSALIDLVMKHANTKFVVLSGYLEPKNAQRLLELKPVYAVLSKESPPDSICYVLLQTIEGRKLGDANGIASLKNANTSRISVPEVQENLTPRLIEVHNLLRSGMSNKMIAHELKLSEGTVKNYITEIFRILKVKNRVQASHQKPTE